MIKLYSDNELTTEICEDVLVEGMVYYVDLLGCSNITVKAWLNDEHLTKFVEYHPKNRILTIRFDNVVGFVNILGKQFDVRSTKLFDGLGGKEQFARLLDDIIDISSKFTFNFKGTSFGARENILKYSNNDLEALDYYYQVVFTYPTNSNLNALMNQCFIHPNSLTTTTYKKVASHKSKLIPTIFYSKIANTSTFVKLRDNHPLISSQFVHKVFEKSGKHLFPTHVINYQFEESYDTKENQFLKFFLIEINTICGRILTSLKDTEIRAKAIRLQYKINHYLQNPFFKQISRLSYLPSSSSVLLKKAGYREVYYHYIQSKLNFRPIVEEQKMILHNARLKNIATLYEIWVFFKIASTLFRQESIKETYGGQILHNGTFLQTYTWEAKQFKLHYNKIFSRTNGGSYSVNLKPDISLELSDGNFYLFDAKYKFNSYESNDENLLLRLVKPEDIHKMHSYLDAIHKAQVSMVIYPGTENIFYDKSGSVIKDNLNLFEINGVGAIPLVPNHDSSHLLALFNTLIP